MSYQIASMSPGLKFFFSGLIFKFLLSVFHLPVSAHWFVVGVCLFVLTLLSLQQKADAMGKIAQNILGYFLVRE